MNFILTGNGHHKVTDPAQNQTATPSKGTLIALEGIDGSGKSTLAPLICDRLHPPSGPAECLSKKTVDYEDTYTRTHLTELRHVIWDEEKPAADVMSGQHWSLLVAAWYAVIQKRRLADHTGTYVSDGWFFRNIIKVLEEHDDIDEPWLHAIFEPIRTPDVTVLIDVAPELALQRGRDFDPRERGERALGGPTDFVIFQSRIRTRLLKMAHLGDWIVVKVLPKHSPKDVADLVARKVSRRLGWKLPLPA